VAKSSQYPPRAIREEIIANLVWSCVLAAVSDFEVGFGQLCEIDGCGCFWSVFLMNEECFKKCEKNILKTWNCEKIVKILMVFFCLVLIMFSGYFLFAPLELFYQNLLCFWAFFVPKLTYISRSLQSKINLHF
jgi:hypothetical protein